MLAKAHNYNYKQELSCKSKHIGSILIWQLYYSLNMFLDIKYEKEETGSFTN